MKFAVVEVGPQTIRGPDSVPPEWSSAAIESVDDRIALVGGRAVEVDRLWRDVLKAAVGGPARKLVLIFPTWWSASRIDLIVDAARSCAAESVVLRRASVLGIEGDATVVELSEEFVVIAAPRAEIVVLPRGSHDVAEFLGLASDVVIDVPAEVSVLAPLPATAALVFTDRQHLMRSVSIWLAARRLAKPTRDRQRSGRCAAAALAGTLLAVAAGGVGWVAQDLPARPATDASTVLLVEGRVTVRVPAEWRVERITSGPGSARVRVSPMGGSTALHITQSAGAAPATLAEVAETLRRAIESERRGVFVDLNPADTVGGRSAVTYRELRADSETRWAVVVDGVIRIAVGCQGPAGRSETISEVCLRAVVSAHVQR